MGTNDIEQFAENNNNVASPNPMPTLPDADLKLGAVATVQPSDAEQEEPWNSAGSPDKAEEAWKSAGSTGSRLSVSGDHIDMNKLLDLWKAVHIAEQCIGAHVFCAFVVGLHLSYVLNDTINGDPLTVSSESQSWYTACSITRSAVLVFMSEFVTNGGSWWGRKKMLRFSQTMYFLLCATSMVALAANAAFLHVIANVWQGCCSGDKASVLAYVSDVSTVETHKKNVGYVALWAGVGLVAAMVGYLALPPMGGYACACALVLTSCLVREFGLPDISPPLEKRTVPTWMSILQTAFPCNMYTSYVPQTMYVKCLLWTQFFQYASLGSFHAYFANFILIRFGMARMQAGALVAVIGVLSSITVALGLKYLPIESTFYLMWMTPLYTLYITFMPAKHTMWSGLVLFVPRLIPLAQLDVIFYGQLSARRRHELASLENMLERLGYLAGAVGVAIYSPMWIDNYQDGDQSYPSVAVVTLVFDIFVVLIFYLGTNRYKHLDMYGKFFMVAQEGAEACKGGTAFETTFASGVRVSVKDEGMVAGICEGKVPEGRKSGATGGYMVRLEDGNMVEVKPENLELRELELETGGAA